MQRKKKDKKKLYIYLDKNKETSFNQIVHYKFEENPRKNSLTKKNVEKKDLDQINIIKSIINFQMIIL